MKIRSISLTNFRRFVGTSAIEGIGDGVSVLVGRNEIGKSTLLQAINGVIFEKAKSTSQHVKSFRHTTNGTVPEVEMAFELENKKWTIRKRFAGQAGKAVLLSAEGRRYEDEAAEAELQRLLGFSGGRGSAEPGIWGTLWVQQGHSFGHPDLDDQARRTLQSCLEAQVGAVTGGIRGHRIPESVAVALSELVSSKGPRGAYKASQEALDEATQREMDLTAKRSELFKQMDALADLKRELRDRLADWDEIEHGRELEAERAKGTAAATKASELQAARSAVKLAEQSAANAHDAVDERDRLVKELASVEGKAAAAKEKLQAAETARGSAFSSTEAAETALAALRENARDVADRSRRLERIRGARLLTGQIARHSETIERAGSLEQEAHTVASEIGKIPANAQLVLHIEEATTALSAAQAKIDAVATTVSFDLENPAAVNFGGDSLTEKSSTHPITAATVIAIKDVGKILISPQITNREVITRQLIDARAELKSALETAGVSDLATARHAAARRQQLEARASEIKRELAGLAPGDVESKLTVGLDALRTRVSELRGRLETELAILGSDELPEVAEVDRMIGEAHSDGEHMARVIQEAETALAGFNVTLRQADAALHSLQQSTATLLGRRDNAAATLAASRARLDDEDLKRQVDVLDREFTKQQELLNSLERDRGEAVEAINARIKRLEGAEKGQSDAVSQLHQDIARLTAFLEANEGSGVEEALEASKAERVRLQGVVDDYQQETDVLRLLLTTLRRAESEAKTRYLTPVLARVEPYLKMLLPESEIVLDENLGISALMREGGREEFSSLSGGTQEQIAVLARLAFAELLLGRGRPATVILDDALAFSDDDRIERMFDVLMRAGENVQIIVLTCRKRLFTRLGAQTLQLHEVV